jgi:hypothetical protein
MCGECYVLSIEEAGVDGGFVLVDVETTAEEDAGVEGGD